MGPKEPGYLWKAERIRNLSIVKNLGKKFSLFILKSLKTRVAAIGPRGCNRFYSGTPVNEEGRVERINEKFTIEVKIQRQQYSERMLDLCFCVKGHSNKKTYKRAKVIPTKTYKRAKICPGC